jgi:hypothetical protein
MMLAVNAAVDILVIVYIGLLIRQRNLAAEREMKLRFLPPAALAAERAAAARRAVSGYHPSGRYGRSGYRDVLAGRTAN